ncbi:MAG: hypothetical protein KDA48_07040 [Amphiplicatus sp.]|nr:hypothetical protein [Amphiplicatus sp.]
MVDVLQITGFESERLGEEARLGEAKQCRFANDSFEDIENARFLQKQYDFRGYSFRTSFLGKYLASYLRPPLLSNDPMLREVEWKLREVSRYCTNKFEVIAGGKPNYRLLAYAMSHPELSASDVRRIAHEHTGLCVREYLQLGFVIAAIAHREEDLEVVRNIALYAQLHMGAAPDIAPRVDLLLAEIDQKADENAERPSPLSGARFLCDRYYTILRDLDASMICAPEAADRLDGAKPYDALDVYYYALRAKALGWRDVAQAEKKAEGFLTPECAAAMRQFEVDERGGAVNPRDFKNSSWPANTGEPCGYLFESPED